jgi:hypothetical protein
MRKTREVQITSEGRDKGKTFVVTEMSAQRAESWAMRAMGAMARSGVQIPDDVVAGGIVSFAAAGLKAFMAAPWDDVKPMLDELMECVQIKEAITRSLTPDDVEEIGTFVKLRDEVIELHVGFSLAAVLLGAVALSQTPPSETTSTSVASSEPSSLAA